MAYTIRRETKQAKAMFRTLKNVENLLRSGKTQEAAEVVTSSRRRRIDLGHFKIVGEARSAVLKDETEFESPSWEAL